MEISRKIMSALLSWKQKEGRKPLIIQGARQIGKTWIMQKFGNEHFEHVAYFNFEMSEELCREFDKTKTPVRLLEMLRFYTDQPIVAGRTLIVFDEVQQCNKALNSLKYFSEEAPEYHIVAAGSLLGVSLSHGDSFPVGKVEFLRMFPITFSEFLCSYNSKVFNFVESITEIQPLPEIVMGQLEEAYRLYSVSGGMPAAVIAMLEKKGIEAVEESLRSILISYTLDFAKHAPNKDIPRISAIWRSVPSQLAKENRKFVYKLVKNGARAREYEDGLLWLEHAGLIYRIFCSSKPGLPISAYDDLSAFKIYLSDTGILRSLADLPADIFWTDSVAYTEFKGALVENMVLQSLVANFDVIPRYWTSNGTAEVDFLLQNGLSLLPVEVKASTNISGKSLGVYINRFDPKLALRYSLKELKLIDKVLNIPIFLADWTPKFLEIANEVAGGKM